MGERQKGDEIVGLNIATLIGSMWIEQVKANPQAIQKPKGISISCSGHGEIHLPRKQAIVLASALGEILRKALHRGNWRFSVQVRDEGRQWCVEVSTEFMSLDKDSPELTSARNLVERELNGTIEVHSTTVKIRFPHHQTPSSQQTPSSFWSSLLAFWKKRR